MKLQPHHHAKSLGREVGGKVDSSMARRRRDEEKVSNVHSCLRFELGFFGFCARRGMGGI